MEARETVGANDLGSQATTRVALAAVRAAQGKHAEAERLLREAVELLADTGFVGARTEMLHALAMYLRSRGRTEEAAELERQKLELTPASARPEPTRPAARVVSG
jgi:tetratricopeptide (TPR) repeat protein